MIDVEEILSMAYLVSDMNDSWIVNSHIDLETWNKVYDRE
jgi:hypothetical protein